MLCSNPGKACYFSPMSQDLRLSSILQIDADLLKSGGSFEQFFLFNHLPTC